MNIPEFSTLCRDEMNANGLHLWSFGFNYKKKRVLGACYFNNRYLEFSHFFINNNPTEKVIDTIRHEIAHALAGVAAKHGPVWQAMAVKVGASPVACCLSGDVTMPQSTYVFICKCRTHNFYRKPKYMGRRCKMCGFSGEVTKAKG